jgi:hypothetical protein
MCCLAVSSAYPGLDSLFAAFGINYSGKPSSGLSLAPPILHYHYPGNHHQASSKVAQA